MKATPPKTTANVNLNQAREARKDEFYTRLHDIETELRHYEKQFKGKVVYCNCDDPRISNFFHYFSYKFEPLGLKKLMTTCYKNQNPDMFSQHQAEKAIYIEYKADANGKLIPYPDYMKLITGEYKGGKDENNVLELKEIGIGHLEGDGDFRKPECIELLKQADIVVTNPPFSLFREYVAQLIEHGKKFLILGDQNAVTYKEIFRFIKENKVWLGMNNGGTKWFEVKDYYDIKTESRKKIENGKKYFSAGKINWFTNMDTAKRHENLLLYKTYKGNETDYPKYDNYDAIEVSKTKDIPTDYRGVMGVPVTFFDKYNPEQFELVGMAEDNGRGYSGGIWQGGSIKCLVNGEAKFKRLFIKHRM